MNVVDYSPSNEPSLRQQMDALRKGLGRAVQWSLKGKLDDGPLLAACLQDQRFDVQIDDPRGDWLWEMIQWLNAAERYRVPILHALYDLTDDCTANQLCRLARHYAEAGDETFRTLLYEIVERKPFADLPRLGEEEIVAMDGDQAFLFAAKVRGQALAAREWEWDDRSIIDFAIERLGEEQVVRLLDAAVDEAVSRFRENWRQDKQKKAQRSSPHSHRERMTSISAQEILQAAENGNRHFWFRGWGMHADAADLRAVLQRLWLEQEPKVIFNLLQVFSARPLPEFDSRMIELCEHRDPEVRQRAFNALERNAHPLVREFALTELGKGTWSSSVVALFINNFRRGDEHRLLEAIELPADENELHWLLMDVIKVLENNSEADSFRLGVISYALTPCAMCRSYAARLLLNRQIAPEWLMGECRYDSDEDCRELVAASGGSKAVG